MQRLVIAASESEPFKLLVTEIERSCGFVFDFVHGSLFPSGRWHEPEAVSMMRLPQSEPDHGRAQRTAAYCGGGSVRPTSLWNSGSSCRHERSVSLAAQSRLLYPAANAFLIVSSASAFFPRTPYVQPAL